MSYSHKVENLISAGGRRGGPIKRERERESGVRGLESVLKKITGGTLIRDSRVIVNVVGFTNLFDSPK